MEPRDLTLEEAIELLTTKPRSGHLHAEDGFLTVRYYETSYRNVAFCDGHIEWMGQFTDAEVAKGLLTAAGGEGTSIDYDWATYSPQQVRTVVKWGKVWGLSVFVVLSLLPAAWVWRGRTKESSAAAEDCGAGDA